MLIKYARNLTADRQTGQTAEFWADVENDLRQGSSDFQAGYQYLAQYFEQDVSLTADEKQRYQERLKLAQTQSNRDEQVKAILNLLEVRRVDLPVALRPGQTHTRGVGILMGRFVIEATHVSFSATDRFTAKAL